MSGIALDLSVDAGELTRALVDVPSVSGAEDVLAGAVADALPPSLAVQRRGNVVLARTDLGRPQRIVLAGHLDTVPIATRDDGRTNVPSRIEDDLLLGCGTSDMKSGVALALRAAHLVGTGTLDPAVDLTWVFYDCEEIEAERNGLRRLAVDDPMLLAGDLAILLEPTDGLLEGGCQGTLRVEVRLPGRRAHTARSWLGANAIHAAAPVLQRLADYRAREPEVDGLRYHEGLSAVRISGGVAGNVVPDECVVTVNHRFAPDRSEAAALEHVRSVFDGFEVRLTDSAPAARPGLDAPLAQRFAAGVGTPPRAKLGWTDVARFATLGIPALNFGPGDPNVAHTVDEHVSLTAVRAAEGALLRFLTAS